MKDPRKDNLTERFYKQISADANYRDWLKKNGYNTECEHFTLQKDGCFYCNIHKVLILCNGRCRNKTNK